MVEIILSVLMVPVAFLLWAYIHERAHLFAAQQLVGVRDYNISILPGFLNDAWYWAYISYTLERHPTDEEEFVISMAPRAPAMVACILLPFVAWLGWWPLIILVGGGLVDQINGSLGIRETSDLRKAAVYMKQNPWRLRAVGLMWAFISLSFSLLALLL